MIRVEAASRLHFGLLHVPVSGDTSRRQFGGCGLMVEQPGLTVTVSAADSWEAVGPHAGRALAFAQRVVESLDPPKRQPVRIVVEQAPPEHVGLGVGTQLGLSVADAVCEELARTTCTADALARKAGRGLRSRIGVVGYRKGGFLVDGGQPPEGTHASTILAQLDFPYRWRIVLARPQVSDLWHGDAERQAFTRPRDSEQAERTTDRLSRLLLFGILPALKEWNFTEFSERLFDYNRLAGEAFTPDQGGAYAGPAVTALIEKLREWDVAGVGQSSWGPTVFAVCESEERANTIAERLQSGITDLESVMVTKAARNGAAMSRDGKCLYPPKEKVLQCNDCTIASYREP